MNRSLKNRILNIQFSDCEEEIIKRDALKISQNQHMKLRFVSAEAPNRQGVFLSMADDEGELLINGISGKSFILWKDECTDELEIECRCDEGFLIIYNVFEKKSWTGKNEMYSQTDFSGMILEQKGKIYRYHCNNATKDSSFDKLVFEVELA